MVYPVTKRVGTVRKPEEITLFAMLRISELKIYPQNILTESRQVSEKGGKCKRIPGVQTSIHLWMNYIFHNRE